MGNWKHIELGSLINFRRGFDLPKTDMISGQYPVVASNGIIGYHNQYTTKAPVITIGRSGNVGTPYFYDENCWAHNTTLVIDAFYNCEPKFIYYLLKTLNLQNYRGGSAVPTLNRNHIHPIKVYVPEPKEEQKAIADVLSSFDDKIELNNKIIKNLEDQAQSLYKHWFVDFEFPNKEGKPYKSSGGKFKESELGLIPENWDVLSFGDLFKIKSGYPFKSSTYLDEGCFKIITIKNVLEDGLDTSKVSYINTLPSDLPEYCKLNIGDILVSLTGNIGRVCSVIENNLLLNQRVGKICCTNDNYKNFINCILKQQCIKDMLISISRGTAQQNLSPVECLNLKIPGNLKFIEEFSKLVDGFISKNIELQIENKKLEETRDYLLQKLMNGEIKVPDVK